MKHFILIVLSIFLVLSAQSQCKKRLLKDATYYYEYNNYSNAIEYFKKYYAIDSTNSAVNFAIGKCLFYIANNKQEAIPYLKKSNSVEALFYLARICHQKEQCAEAISYYQQYMNAPQPKEYTDSVISYYLNKSYTAQRFISMPRDVKIINLGSNINSPLPDYVPIISNDENTMFFTSRRSGGISNNLDPMGNYFEDIYVSHYINGQWSDAKNLGAPVNTPTHESCLGVSPDKSQMFIYRTNAETTGGGIYEVKYKDSVWSEPQWVHAEFNELDAREKTICLIPSPDSSTYYFVSDKVGGFGGTDLYKIFRFGDGRWSLPENLGPEINTPYDEDSPFFHPDENTLYFSSKGHENMGDYDIFLATYQDDGTWSVPQNLGYPINTVGGDRFLNVSPDGRRGYYSKAKEPGSNDIDIFLLEIAPDDMKYIVTTGIIQDSENQKPVNAKILLNEKGITSIYGIYKPNLNTSRYIVILRPGVTYEVTITADGYESQKQELFYPIDTRETELLLNFNLKRK